jgi:hypothetical protein
MHGNAKAGAPKDAPAPDILVPIRVWVARPP